MKLLQPMKCWIYVWILCCVLFWLAVQFVLQWEHREDEEAKRKTDFEEWSHGDPVCLDDLKSASSVLISHVGSNISFVWKCEDTSGRKCVSGYLNYFCIN